MTEGDVARSRSPDVRSAYFRCGIVDPAIGAVCTKRPHRDREGHQGFEAVAGAGQDRRLAAWRGGAERVMVVEQGYTWTRVPDTDIEIRVRANRPVALRYRRQAGGTPATQ